MPIKIRNSKIQNKNVKCFLKVEKGGSLSSSVGGPKTMSNESR